MLTCRPRSLTEAQAARALRRSVEVNPDNAAELRRIERSETGRRGGAKRLVVSVGHRWPARGVRLGVQFLDDPPKTLRARILAHMNAWSDYAQVRFDETRELGEVRIARLEAPEDMAGYWSYLGTEILAIEDDAPTMNLQGFTLKTPEAELRRVVRHEAGHTLGFEHEHLRAEMVRRIDRRRAIAWFDRAYGWTTEETITQVLTPLSDASVFGTRESDPKSIMCYEVPAAITRNGRRIVGGRDISRRDAAFAARTYPRDAASGPAVHAVRARGGDVGPGAGRRGPGGGGVHPTAAPDAETFHLVVLDPFGPDGDAATRPAYVRLFASYAGARVTAPMRVRAERGEKPTRFRQIIATHERIKRYTGFEAGNLPDDAALVRFGADLFETLFQGDVRRLYDEARARTQGGRLDLVLTSMVPWIAEKPWEFAYDRSRGSFLATEDIHFVRNVLTGMPGEAMKPHVGPLRILVVAAQPVGAGRLSIGQETRVIRRGFEHLVEAGLAEVEVLARATPGAMHERLQDERFNVVHFIGHGIFDESAGQGFLLFEDEHGHELRLGERPLREILCRRGIDLVFLNACQSGTGGRADFNKGVAQSLVAHGLPALVANQYSVLDSSATAFARHFYRALATGHSLGEAARESRIAVNYALQGEAIDWAIPVVYARDPGMRLCASGGTGTAGPRGARAAGATRRDKPVAIAVWDVDHAFPALNDTLARLDATQDTFGFRLADISAPVSAWDLGNRAPDGGPYLWAERVAARLARLPVELQARVVVCVTRHRLRDDNTLNIHAWWPESGQPGVLIVSSAGLDELPAEGPLTDAFFANVIAASLAGYFGGLRTHARGPKSCPLWRNPGRELAPLRKPQKFDARCREALHRARPDLVDALDALAQAVEGAGRG